MTELIEVSVNDLLRMLRMLRAPEYDARSTGSAAG